MTTPRIAQALPELYRAARLQVGELLEGQYLQMTFQGLCRLLCTKGSRLGQLLRDNLTEPVSYTHLTLPTTPYV